jgi:uncharacterized protein YcfJ
MRFQGVTAAAMVAVVALSGCVTVPAYSPVVDLKNTDLVALQQDLADCTAYATKISPANSAVAGAVVGAIVGAAVGAAVGGKGTVAFSTKMGAIEGAESGTSTALQTQHAILNNCLVERGYNVLY